MNPKVHLKQPGTFFSSKRKKEKEKVQLGFTSTYVFIVCIISSLLLYYVWILNVNATKGFNIRELEKDKRELQVELEKLNVKIAELESLDTILESGDIENMVEIDDPDYLVIREGVQYVYNN